MMLGSCDDLLTSEEMKLVMLSMAYLPNSATAKVVSNRPGFRLIRTRLRLLSPVVFVSHCLRLAVAVCRLLSRSSRLLVPTCPPPPVALSVCLASRDARLPYLSDCSKTATVGYESIGETSVCVA